MIGPHFFPGAFTRAVAYERAIVQVMVRADLSRARAIEMLHAFTATTVMTPTQAAAHIERVIDTGAWPIEYRPLGLTAGLLQALHRVERRL